MIKQNLPLCPCGSGKLYEECCYKKIGSDGEPLFFKGAFTSNDGGNTWHPIPNARFKAILVGETTDKYREYAKELVKKSKLAEKNYKEFINCCGLFYHSYDLLTKIFEKPMGKGVSFQSDTIEIRKYWREYLFNGRILLDFIGLHSRETLGLDQDIGGLNDKKYELILSTLEKLGIKDKKYLDIKTKIEPLKSDIEIFIRFRDIEKRPQNTIIEFPVIDYEYGLVEDGKVNADGNIFEMNKFIKNSYGSIHKLTLVLLGIE